MLSVALANPTLGHYVYVKFLRAIRRQRGIDPLTITPRTFLAPAVLVAVDIAQDFILGGYTFEPIDSSDSRQKKVVMQGDALHAVV